MSIQFRMAIARSFSGTLTVLLGLDFNADEGCGFLLGLDHANGLPVSEKEVVGLAKAVPQGEFSDGNAWAGVDVGIGPVLDKPSGGNEHAVDGLAGFFFRRQNCQKALGNQCMTTTRDVLSRCRKPPYLPVLNGWLNSDCRTQRL